MEHLSPLHLELSPNTNKRLNYMNKCERRRQWWFLLGFAGMVWSKRRFWLPTIICNLDLYCVFLQILNWGSFYNIWSVPMIEIKGPQESVLLSKNKEDMDNNRIWRVQPETRGWNHVSLEILGAKNSHMGVLGFGIFPRLYLGVLIGFSRCHVALANLKTSSQVRVQTLSFSCADLSLKLTSFEHLTQPS